MEWAAGHLSNLHSLSCGLEFCGKCLFTVLDSKASTLLKKPNLEWDQQVVTNMCQLFYHLFHSSNLLDPSQIIIDFMYQHQFVRGDLEDEVFSKPDSVRRLAVLTANSGHYRVYHIKYDSHMVEIVDGLSPRNRNHDSVRFTELNAEEKRIAEKYIPTSEISSWEFKLTFYYTQRDVVNCGPIAVLSACYALTGTTLLQQQSVPPHEFNPVCRQVLVDHYMSYVETLLESNILYSSNSTGIDDTSSNATGNGSETIGDESEKKDDGGKRKRAVADDHDKSVQKEKGAARQRKHRLKDDGAKDMRKARDAARKRKHRAKKKLEDSGADDKAKAVRREKEAARKRKLRAQRKEKRADVYDQYTHVDGIELSEEFLNSFETNVFAGQAAFWHESFNHRFSKYRDLDFEKLSDQQKMELENAIKAEKVTDEDMERCMARYTNICNPCIPTKACGCCGFLDLPISDPSIDASVFEVRTYTQCSLGDGLLAPLIYTEPEEKKFSSPVPVHISDTPENRLLWERYRLIISQVFYNEEKRFHLYPELVHENKTDICNVCHDYLRKEKKRPPISIGNDFDLGNPYRAGFSKPSFAVELCLSRARVLCSAINIRLGKSGSHHSVHGHTIVFPDNAADKCGDSMPDAKFAKQGVVICLKGPNGVVSSPHLEGMIKNLHSLRVDPVEVADWLRMLKFMNPLYYNITIKESMEGERAIHDFINGILDNMEYFDTDIHDERAQDILTSNIMREADDAKPTSTVMDDVEISEASHCAFMIERFTSTAASMATERTLASVRRAVTGSDTDRITLDRGGCALNDYEERDYIMYGGFPVIFPLGMGCGPGKGPLDEKVRKFLVHHFLRRPAVDQRFIMHLHNTKFRSDCGRVMKMSVRNESSKLNEFFNLVNSAEFQKRIDTAIRHPNASDTKKLIKELCPLVLITGSKIPFSPLERGTRACTEMIGITRFKDTPLAFLTVGPNETKTAIIARIACSQNGSLHSASINPTDSSYDFWTKASEDPSRDFVDDAHLLHRLANPLGEPTEVWRKEISEAVMNDPVAVALMCQRLVDGVLEALCGIQITRNRRKSKIIPIEKMKKGAFGRAHSYFWVTELMGRDQLHWHILLWGGLPSWLSQRCAGVGSLGQYVADVLESSFSAYSGSRVHAVRLLRKLHGDAPLRPAMYCPPPLGSKGEYIRELGETVAACTNCHSHCSTCRKGKTGIKECRLCYGRPFSVPPNSFSVPPSVTDGDESAYVTVQNKIARSNPLPLEIAHVECRNESGEVFDYVPQANFHTTPPPICGNGVMDTVPDLENDAGSIQDDDEEEVRLMKDLAQRLKSICYPGNDQRFIEYPLLRPRIDITGDVFDDVDLNASMKEILLRQYHRLLSACNKIRANPAEIDADSVLDDIYDAISKMSKELGMGDIIKDSELIGDEDVVDEIKTLPISDRIEFIDLLSQQNSLIGESNALLSAALGCNVNAQALIGRQSSYLAMFYIMDYLSKDSMQPSEILPFIKAAKRRCDLYAGKAPSGEDPLADNRPMRRLGQVVQNGLAATAEIGIQQCALNIAGLPSHECSSQFWNVHSSDAIQYLRKQTERANGNDDADMAVEEAVNRGLHPKDRRCSATVSRAIKKDDEDNDDVGDDDCDKQFDPFVFYDDKVNDSDGGVFLPTANLEKDNYGELTITTQFLEYINRSPRLCFLSLTEFACITSLIRKPYPGNAEDDMDEYVNKAEGAGGTVGRKANSTFAFQSSYDLYEKMHIRLSSIIRVPLYGGFKSVPTFSPGNENRFSEFVLAVLIPIPSQTHAYDDVADDPCIRLARILPLLQKGEFLLNKEEKCFVGPPGYENVRVMAESPDGRALAFSQQCLARFIGTLAHGFVRPPTKLRKVYPTWRSRYAQQWGLPDPDAKLFPHQYMRANRASRKGDYDDDEMSDQKNVSEKEIFDFYLDVLRKHNNVDMHGTSSSNQSEKTEAYLSRMLRGVHLVRNPCNDNSDAGTDRKSSTDPPGIEYIQGKADDVTSVLRVVTNDPDPENGPADEDQRPANMDPSNRLSSVEDIVLNVMKKYNMKPNEKQLVVLNRMAEYIKNGGPPPMIFLEGAGGTGKSYLFSCLEYLCHEMGEVMCLSAMTGAACTAHDSKIYQSRTTHSLLGIPIFLKNMKQLSAASLAKLRALLNDAVIIVIDEAGFSAPSFLGAVDFRLRELFDPNMINGGKVVIYAGDFYQLPPVRSLPMWKLAFKYCDPKYILNCGNNIVQQLEMNGTRIFVQAELYSLTEQMRCVDMQLQQLNDMVRRGESRDVLKEYMLAHILSAADASEFADARIISPGNLERFFLNKVLIQHYAHVRGQRVISWNLHATYRGSDIMVDDEYVSKESFEKMMENNPNLMGHFAPGAPGFLTSNMCPLRGLANGTPIKLVALHWDNPEVESEAIAFLEKHTGDVVLPRGLEPSNILVCPVVSDKLKSLWPMNGTCVEDDIVIPVEVIVENDVIKSNEKSLDVKIERHQFDLGFVTTVYKSQGATLDRVIASLLERPCNPSREDFFSIYVILTRVRQGSHFRVIADPNDLDWLDDIKPPNMLIAFMHGYDESGKWIYERAKSKLDSLDAENSTPKRKRKGTSSSSSPKKRVRVDGNPILPSVNKSKDQSTNDSPSTNKRKDQSTNESPLKTTSCKIKDFNTKQREEIAELHRDFPLLSDAQIRTFLLNRTGSNASDIIARIMALDPSESEIETLQRRVARHNIDSVQRDSFRRLKVGKWLNDELIHFYLTILGHRDADLCRQSAYPRKRCHFYKSYFFTKLLDEGVTNAFNYNNVSRWSNPVPNRDIFGLDKLIIPVNIGNAHWACVVVYFESRTIQFYDSLGGDGMHYMRELLNYLEHEWADKHRGEPPLDRNAWTLRTTTIDTPTQQNGCDCGVFVCYYADYLSLGLPLSLTQENMTEFRERIALAILGLPVII